MDGTETKVARGKTPTYPVSTSVCDRTRLAERAFTLVEAVVALAVLSILASVIFSATLGLIKADAAASRTIESGFIASRIAVETWLPDCSPYDIIEDLQNWEITSEQSEMAAEDGQTAALDFWKVALKGRPVLGSEFYLRAVSGKKSPLLGRLRGISGGSAENSVKNK
jgi:prepilin-type N-terminal cleavage/methylation domain-containing protein